MSAAVVFLVWATVAAALLVASRRLCTSRARWGRLWWGFCLNWPSTLVVFMLVGAVCVFRYMLGLAEFEWDRTYWDRAFKEKSKRQAQRLRGQLRRHEETMRWHLQAAEKERVLLRHREARVAEAERRLGVVNQEGEGSG